MLYTKEYLIEKTATNEYEIEYINNLTDEIFNQIVEAIEYNEKESVTFKDIQEYGMILSVMRYDFITREKLKKRYPNEEYADFHLKEMTNEWEIYRNVNDETTMKIVMADQHFYTMSRFGTGLDLSSYVKFNYVADWFTIVDLNGREMCGFPVAQKHAQAN
ncbi:hypothetical protein [Lysinibacillus sp. BPa_S21]|uniref:hypothetical protein n=1 Tax=Lysinibacillus sp. BPa_S21 TaxID=2932478 RepID=UPI0020135A4F|nr:hypothetical protein [Lysinibacillus sp. BPa_S21]MCL1696298.1 hypothetical protein [Lysinibacillus sp. BPa_S21]